ncbi:MAG: phosphoadenylyl-sulfate reductase [Acidobacteriota bacterium]|nr:phosphoadenylyl-sulfate reductase [Acidobacteriota bacterium]
MRKPTLSRPPMDAVTSGRALETASPLNILRWAVDTFDSRLTFGTGFGAEECVLIDLIGRHRLPIDLFALDTGLLFPETYTLWSQLEDRYELTIRGARPSLTAEEQNRVYGRELWSHDPDRCCNIHKVTPLTAEFLRFDAWITGIRRDQTIHRAHALAVEWDQEFGLSNVNPLVRWTKKDVWSHLLSHEVPYNPLHDYGFPSSGYHPCTSRVSDGEDDRAGRWRGCATNESGLHSPVTPVEAVAASSPW